MLLASLGCSPAPPSVNDAGTDAPSPSGTVDLGTGQLSWEPLDPAGGTRVELIHGPQGGYHLFGRVRYTGVGPDVYVRFRVTPVDGASPLNDPAERIHLIEGRGLARVGNGWETPNAQLVVLVNIQTPSAVVGRRVRFEVSVAPSPGLETTPALRVSREVLVVDDT